ncbi:MAG: hypothetical protein NTY87_01585 [Planctomycetia bacterium]|nr:hypothetical protein [Planctomycetia bacterium]RLT14206.1 MAG: hypothetical protein DWI25_05425 [Planctomycetota bacterium]
MMLDLLDRSLVQRFLNPSPVTGSVGFSQPCAQAVVLESAVSLDAAAIPAGSFLPRATLSAESSAAVPDQLLCQAPLEWQALAECVLEAHAQGCRVVAITGARRREGRTTIVQGLARAITAQGQSVLCFNRVADISERSHSDGSRQFDILDDIALVDAGVWFPPGPFRRHVLQEMSLGCDAVLLVRRYDAPCCAGRGRAIESIGLKLLGEVLTFTPGVAVH